MCSRPNNSPPQISHQQRTYLRLSCQLCPIYTCTYLYINIYIYIYICTVAFDVDMYPNYPTLLQPSTNKVWHLGGEPIYNWTSLTCSRNNGYINVDVGCAPGNPRYTIYSLYTLCAKSSLRISPPSWHKCRTALTQRCFDRPAQNRIGRLIGTPKKSIASGKCHILSPHYYF